MITFHHACPNNLKSNNIMVPGIFAIVKKELYTISCPTIPHFLAL